MTMRFTSYVVMTTATGLGNHDHGSWSYHTDKEDAQACAAQVKGRLYRMTVSLDGDKRKETLRRIEA